VTELLDLRAEARVRLPALPWLPALQPAAIATWRRRMINEYQSGAVFAGLARQAAQAGLAPGLVDELRAFELEERRHGALCGSVVEALGAEARAEVEPRPALPEHVDVTPLEALARNVLSVSCLSETIAVALIGAERLEMPEGELRELLTRIWADEVGHARFGWRLLHDLVPGFDAAERARLSLYLRVALRHLERHELAHLPLGSQPPPAGAALGLCSGADARTLFYQTVAEAILPALDGLGLAASAAWAARASADTALEAKRVGGSAP
jgi:hypothetical protein